MTITTNRAEDTMTSTVDAERSNRLPELAARIKAEHEACTAALKRGIEHAVAAGKLLTEAKAQLPHGQWLPWLRDHCGIPERSARRYMQIAPCAVAPGDESISANLADMTAEDDRPGAWLDAPFTKADYEHGLVETKLLHQAQLPVAVSVALALSPEDGPPLLRLYGYDDLAEAIRTLAAIEPGGERVLKVEACTVVELQFVAGVVWVDAERTLGGVLNETERRCKRGYTEEQYRRDWDETHAALMAWLKEIAEVERRVTDLMTKVGAKLAVMKSGPSS